MRHHDPVREEVIALRKRNYSVYDISHAFDERGRKVTTAAIRDILRQEGFAPLPRRFDEERPARSGPAVQAVADVRMFSLEEREFTTQCGGLFLFVPDLVKLNLPELATVAGLPGSKSIPASHALLSTLALKLWSIERKSHVMSLVADSGLALFAGLNVIPKAYAPFEIESSELEKESVRQAIERLKCRCGFRKITLVDDRQLNMF
jgi:hypothetical protein